MVKEHVTYENFGMNVFDDRVMRERLPKDTYKSLRKVIDQNLPLDPSLAEVVANAMKDWAISRGATHYTHWFQPLNGCTAEKHESFLSPNKDGGAIMEFSGKMLTQGESDASSFPSGGLRATFEARGYTMWDPTSPAFLKEDKSGVTLCIPTAFCSYTGEALDEKTPLLRSGRALNTQALRILRLFGDHMVTRVSANVGVEQEYFLIDLDDYKARMDLMLTGRTLFGAKPPKCQEMDDYYFAMLDERIASFMKELDEELWKMGVSAKTKHNEAAPCQHELAPIFSVDNIAADQNQLIMETMHKVAQRYNLACLLHEKPFQYVNGSGKHNNWSISTDTGVNLLEPGKNPYDNAKFLVFLCAVIKAVDTHAGLLRASTASAGNDHRLGAGEAPPAIISMFLGEEILAVIKNIAKNRENNPSDNRILDFGVETLPRVSADSNDRNRTSPFAFTGNKFEFRMLGSSMSVSWTNTVLNLTVAQALDEFATMLEVSTDFDATIKEIITTTYQQHKRIFFDGNGYSQEWVEEAARRGLPNLTDTVSCAAALIDPKTTELFEHYGVYTNGELHAKYQVMLETYMKNRMIEANTMVYMVQRQLYPAAVNYARDLMQTQQCFANFDMADSGVMEKVSHIRSLLLDSDRTVAFLKEKMQQVKGASPTLKQAEICAQEMLPIMEQLRRIWDEMETITSKQYWPFPDYFEMLFGRD